MLQKKIKRINKLAKKAKTSELTEDEKEEQKLLRQEYIEAYKANLKDTLENIVIVDENGNKKRIEHKQ
jgi:uncharacterized protein YnzC (UPF0291/DUF896 family)